MYVDTSVCVYVGPGGVWMYVGTGVCLRVVCVNENTGVYEKG